MQGMAKTVSKKIKVREFIFSNCKTYFKAALFKTIKNTKKKDIKLLKIQRHGG